MLIFFSYIFIISFSCRASAQLPISISINDIMVTWQFFGSQRETMGAFR